MANCEKDGHLWNALQKCVMCGTPKPHAPSGLHSCPFCGSFDVKLFKADGKEYVQCQECTACGPDHTETRHWNKLAPLRRPAEGCYCPPDKCMAPVILGIQTPCLRRTVKASENQHGN